MAEVQQTDKRDRLNTLRYSVSSLFRVIKEQDEEKWDVLAASEYRCFER